MPYIKTTVIFPGVFRNIIIYKYSTFFCDSITVINVKKYEKTFEAQIPSVHVLKLNLYNIIFGFQDDKNLLISSKH